VKIRTGFVSNSSSTSFTVCIKRDKVPADLEWIRLMSEATKNTIKEVVAVDVAARISELEHQISNGPEEKEHLTRIIAAMEKVKDIEEVSDMVRLVREYNSWMKQGKDRPWDPLTYMEYWDDNVLVGLLEDFKNDIAYINIRNTDRQKEIDRLVSLDVENNIVIEFKEDFYGDTKGLSTLCKSLEEKGWATIVKEESS